MSVVRRWTREGMMEFNLDYKRQLHFQFLVEITRQNAILLTLREIVWDTIIALRLFI